MPIWLASPEIACLIVDLQIGKTADMCASVGRMLQLRSSGTNTSFRA